MIMSRNYGLDPPFAAQAVYGTTIASLPTIFVLISILRTLNLF
jgi:hypothetical protein